MEGRNEKGLPDSLFLGRIPWCFTGSTMVAMPLNGGKGFCQRGLFFDSLNSSWSNEEQSCHRVSFVGHSTSDKNKTWKEF